MNPIVTIPPADFFIFFYVGELKGMHNATVVSAGDQAHKVSSCVPGDQQWLRVFKNSSLLESADLAGY